MEARLSDRRVELADLGLVTEYGEDLRNVITYSSLAEQRAFIRSFVKDVKVTGKDILLTYTMPLPPQGITQERSGVLNIVHDGGPEGTRTPDLPSLEGPVCARSQLRHRLKDPMRTLF